jgi:hypothetical protein
MTQAGAQSAADERLVKESPDAEAGKIIDAAARCVLVSFLRRETYSGCDS